MALCWLYAVDPMRHPSLLGDVVVSRIADDDDGDVPEELVRDVLEATTFFIDARAHAGSFCVRRVRSATPRSRLRSGACC